VWSALFGSNANVNGVAGLEGNYVVAAGDFGSSLDFGGGNLDAVRTDVFVAMLHSGGEHLWSHSFGVANPSDPQLGGNTASAAAIAADAAGNVVIVGHSESSIDFGGGESATGGVFVVKLNNDGQHQWSVVNGSGRPHGVGIDAAGNVYVAGTVTDAADFGGGELAAGGGDDVFVLKLDGDGNLIWSQRFGGPSDQTVSGLAVDSAGNVFITGKPGDDLDFGGGVLDEATETPTGYAVKLDFAGGEHVWSTKLENSLQTPEDIALDSSGNVLITGSDFGVTTFVTKLDGSSGDTTWTARWGNLKQGGEAVAVDALGNVLVTGRAEGNKLDFGDGCVRDTAGQDAFVAMLDASGALIFSQIFGDDEDQIGTAAAFDESGHAVIAGLASGSIDFGGEPLTATGEDVFIARLRPPHWESAP